MAKPLDEHDRIKFRRFGPYRIIEHWLHAVIFCLLVVTGLAQKYHAYDFSQWIVYRLGGIDSARLTHRIAGFLLIILVVEHIAIAVFGIAKRRWQASMLIQIKDYRDVITNLKYYFGVKNHPAACDRFDYKQKFDYWGVLVSNTVMIVTGIVLMFPIVTTKFLYGEIVPAANVIHTNQSLLIILVIAIWHIYNSIFSPEIFPLDTSILSGYISRERMQHEHPLELERREREERKALRAARQKHD
ncbi:MAG TPA: cytochrome b/b6 domain-containing protein [Nitrospirota bacterium]|nr:cytochrome b/b6 domain-containing protein [Nitrospirota bacterium]